MMVPIVEPVKGSPLPQLLVPRYLHEVSRLTRCSPIPRTLAETLRDAFGTLGRALVGK